MAAAAAVTAVVAVVTAAAVEGKDSEVAAARGWEAVVVMGWEGGATAAAVGSSRTGLARTATCTTRPRRTTRP